jgi:hypothetical protein
VTRAEIEEAAAILDRVLAGVAAGSEVTT